MRVVVPNKNRVLRRDMFVRVQIKSSARASRHPRARVVGAARRSESAVRVRRRAGEHGFARRRITLGTRVGDTYEVTSGLADGDQVVAEGALFLQFAESQ